MNRSSICALAALSSFALLFACSATGGGTDVDDGDATASGGAVNGGTGGGNLGTGGVVGTGSTTGSGGIEGSGASGSGGEVGTGGTTPGGSGCEGAAFCDDFEDGIDAAWVVQKDSTPPPAVDSTKAKSGTSSMVVSGTSQQAFLAYPVPAQKFYARAFVNFEKGTLDVGGHGWFIVAANNVTSGEESQIRWGASANHGHPEIDMNVYAGTCGGEKTQFSDGASDGGAGWNGTTTESVLLNANEWYCVEIMFDGPSHEAQVWIDDVEATGLHVTEASMCPAWSPTYTHIKFGAGANANVGNVWYDEVAVSTTPIGCPKK
jgi:hypothetical protein